MIVKRILGRKICSKCLLTFNLFFNPPNKDDYECKLFYLQSRSDDNQATIENRFDTCWIATLGKLASIPTIIINEIPLPIPWLVICSPSHITKTVPVTSIIQVVK